MKFYSEALDKMFDSIEECENAEYEAKKKDFEKANQLAKTELETKLKAIDDKLTAAHEYRKDVSNKLAQAIKDCEEETKKKLDPIESELSAAEENIKSLQNDRRDCLAAYNKEYGPYIITTNDLNELADQLGFIFNVF